MSPFKANFGGQLFSFPNMCREKDRIAGYLAGGCSIYSHVQGLGCLLTDLPVCLRRGSHPSLTANTCIRADTWALFLKLFGTQRAFPRVIMALMTVRFLDKFTELGEKKIPIYWTLTLDGRYEHQNPLGSLWKQIVGNHLLSFWFHRSGVRPNNSHL